MFGSGRADVKVTSDQDMDAMLSSCLTFWARGGDKYVFFIINMHCILSNNLKNILYFPFKWQNQTFHRCGNTDVIRVMLLISKNTSKEPKVKCYMLSYY